MEDLLLVVVYNGLVLLHYMQMSFFTLIRSKMHCDQLVHPINIIPVIPSIHCPFTFRTVRLVSFTNLLARVFKIPTAQYESKMTKTFCSSLYLKMNF